MKVAHDHRRVIPAAVQITPQVSHQLRLGASSFSPNRPRRKMTLEDHERQVPSIGNRRKDVCPETVACPGSYRSLPSRGIRPSRLMIRTGPHRVPPIQLCLLYFRSRPEDWVLLIEPSGDSHRIPFVGPPNRLLRGKPPTLKIAPDRPSGKLDTKPPGKQPLNGLRRPQHEGKLQLFSGR